MKRFFDYLTNHWWSSPLICLFVGALFGLSQTFDNQLLQNFSFFIIGLGLLTIFILSVYLLIQRRWLKGLLNLGLVFITIAGIIFYFIILFLESQDSRDNWADDLKIPTDVPIYTPIDLDFNEQRPDSLKNLSCKTNNFQLYNSFQPGLYEYDFWFGKIEKGTIYLKAFEITGESALSTDRLTQQSSVTIYNPSDSIIKLSTNHHFTIYEGDWGKPYAARFEVWFISDKGGKERKLFTKNYIIEGWMR